MKSDIKQLQHSSTTITTFAIFVWLYLVVDHDVDGSVGCKGREVTQVESFIHHALSRESSISMQQNAHNLQYIIHTKKNISLDVCTGIWGFAISIISF